MGNNPVELAPRYRETGWWTDEDIERVPAGGMEAAMDVTLAAFRATRP
jgi:hypothetical protein